MPTRSLALALVVLAACGPDPSSTHLGSKETAAVEITIERKGDGLPRVFASTGERRHRASTGTFTLTYGPRGETTGAGAADGLPNIEVGSPDWAVEAGDVTFHVDPFPGVDSADIEVCLDPRCKRSVAATRLNLTEERTWTVELEEGIYALDMWLRFDRGDAQYLWTFEAR